ncbi:hypothetical protein QBC38DRAFT_478675 [Podospora fimiseda]|uniref:F-box domain-containing protein n=1 Tax=Podospora fimiseda TaxID=252190 RepID=A0AAN7BPD8_9PEZI|nr:hypothetical protein QBC38DRAFT_478675 [Podospora fimiseda]
MENPDNPHGLDEAALERIEGLRRLREAIHGRENATQEQIEALGIRPDVGQMVDHMNNWQYPSSMVYPRGSYHYSRTTARRIYRFINTFPDDDIDIEEDGEFESQWAELIAKQGLEELDILLVAQYKEIARQRMRSLKKATKQWKAAKRILKPRPSIDLIGSLCTASELINTVCKFLRPADILTLYSISKDFHYSLNQYMRGTILNWAKDMAPNAARIYSSPTYNHWFICDPAGRKLTEDDLEANKRRPEHADDLVPSAINQIIGGERHVPGLFWLQVIVAREIRARDILATLARHGHRMPKESLVVLLKIWVIMDAASTSTRVTLISNQDFFTDEELYIGQMFCIKLNLCFNDPVFGPRSSHLMRLMLGQKGLSPLWALLRRKKYTTKNEIRQLKIRYDVPPTPIQLVDGRSFEDVAIDEMGVVHLEGWGHGGQNHLLRPDELILMEACRRQIPFNESVMMMAIYGHVDLKTGNAQVPDIDEMYMSDDELGRVQMGWAPMNHELANGGCGNVPFEPKMWKPKHARKARWDTLTPEMKEDILADDEDEIKAIKNLDKSQDDFAKAHHKLMCLYAKSDVNQLATQFLDIGDPVPEENWEEELQQLRIGIHDPDIPSSSDVEMQDDQQQQHAGEELDQEMPDYMAEDINMDMDVDMDTQVPSYPASPSPSPQHPEAYDASPESSDNSSSSSDSNPSPNPSPNRPTVPQPSSPVPEQQPQPSSSPPSDNSLADIDSDALSLETIPSDELAYMIHHMNDEQYRLLTPENLRHYNISALLGPAHPDSDDDRDPALLFPHQHHQQHPSLSPTPEPVSPPSLTFSVMSSPVQFFQPSDDSEDDNNEDYSTSTDSNIPPNSSDEGDIDVFGFGIPPELRGVPIPSPSDYSDIPRLPSPSYLESINSPERITMTEEEIRAALDAQADMQYDDFEDWENQENQEEAGGRGGGEDGEAQREVDWDEVAKEMRGGDKREIENDESDRESEIGLDEEQKKRRRVLKDWYKPW